MSGAARTRKVLDDMGVKSVTGDLGSQLMDDAEQEKVNIKIGRRAYVPG